MKGGGLSRTTLVGVAVGALFVAAVAAAATQDTDEPSRVAGRTERGTTAPSVSTTEAPPADETTTTDGAATATSAAARPASAPPPSFVPGGFLARLSDGGVVVSRHDGSGRRVLVPRADDESVWGYAWSPDRTQLAFLRGRGQPYFDRSNSGRDQGPARLGVVFADGSGLRILDVNALTAWGESCCWWSPDGSRIAYRSRSGPWMVARADGGGARPIAGINPVWAPDGTAMAVTNESGGLSIADPDGQQPRQIAAKGASPQWSPDGRWLAYPEEQSLAPGAVGRTHVVRADGSDHRAFDGWLTVGWAPDGSRLVVTRGDAGTFAVRPDGSEPRLLAGVPMQWLPDSKSLVTSVDNRVPAVTFLDGRPVRILGPGPMQNAAQVTRSGAWLVYAETSTGQARLHVVATDGTSDKVVGDAFATDLIANSYPATTPPRDIIEDVAVAARTGKRFTVTRFDGRGRWAFD